MKGENLKLKVRENGRTGVRRACEDLLTAEGIRWFRMNAGDRFGSYKGKTWRIRGHAKGTPDILAAVRMKYMGVLKFFPAFVWIEVKAPGKHPTDEQLQFADEARNNGENHMFVDDVTQLDAWLKENRAR